MSTKHSGHQPINKPSSPKIGLLVWSHETTLISFTVKLIVVCKWRMVIRLALCVVCQISMRSWPWHMFYGRKMTECEAYGRAHQAAPCPPSGTGDTVYESVCWNLIETQLMRQNICKICFLHCFFFLAFTSCAVLRKVYNWRGRFLH